MSDERWGRSTLHNKQDRMGAGGTYLCKYSGLFLNCLGPHDVSVDCFTGESLGGSVESFEMVNPHDHTKTISVTFNTPQETAEGAEIIKRALSLHTAVKYSGRFITTLMSIKDNYDLD